MSDRVGIVAAAQTKYDPDRVDVSSGEIAYETVKKVLTETGLSFADDGGIDASVTSSQAAWEGAFISGTVTQAYLGEHLRPADKVSEDSINAVYCAWAQILAGHYDVVLVTTQCMESQTERSRVDNRTFDPIYMGSLGLDFRIAAAMQAMRYMNKYGITPEQCAQVAVKNRGNAKNNPYAQEPLDIKVEDVLKSEVLASPIKRLDTKPKTSDGSCAIILAREEKAKKLTDKPVWITGGNNCYEAHYLGDRDLAECDALVSAAKRAYKMAGIKDVMKDIDVAEISEEFTYQELLWMEGLGFCGRGKAGKLIESGKTRMGGQLPVNPSGGILSGNPVTVSGMTRVAEIYLQLAGKAGDRQVQGATMGLAHGVTGSCGQLQCVMTFSNK